ncbi:putative transcription factor interactor and regulator LIM family [Helianthus annuus]|nr:putative transcription factor interactor and regulator LIM family [Helianthus annuus]KAJ0471663.1 putative transcription factor interactor and regulator LIM family [Helianthus annuus]KAJ0647302.1 putative transcription factor interactor and regulator LIM family [Helianthus annuus]
MILMDEKGDKIQATIKKVLMCVFENQLEEGSVVFLSKFGVGEMNGKFPVIKYSYKLIFYRHTNVKRWGQVEGSSQITPASLSSQTVYSSHEEFLKKYERKSVEEIWDVAVESVFVVLGTIRSVEEDFGWFYVGCSKCSKKVIPASDHVGGLDDIDADDAASDDGVLYCPKCKIRSPTTILRYKIRVRVQDATGTISFVMFDKDVSKVIGRSARDIHDQQLRDGEENVCPREVKQLVGKRYIFKIEISTFNLTSNYHVYTVLKLCDDNEIIKVMLQDDAAEQDVEDVNSEPASGSFTCFKEAFSFTEDSEVPTDAANDDATSPQAAKRSSDVSKDENGDSSSTKRRLLNVKLEK